MAVALSLAWPCGSADAADAATREMAALLKERAPQDRMNAQVAFGAELLSHVDPATFAACCS